MNYLIKNKNFLTKFSTGISIAVLIFALNVSGVFASLGIYGFWRTFDNSTANGVTNPTQYEYGFGYGYGNYGYGYGYGFGYGNFADGRVKATPQLPAPVSLSVGSVLVTVPTNTVVSLDPVSSITNLDIAALAVAALSTSSVDLGGDNPVAALDFGLSGAKLNFSQPIRVDIPVPGYTQATIQIKVKHYGDSSFNTSGLTATPGDSCTNGLPGIPSNVATVSAGIATIYSCSASEFAAYTPAYSGGSTGGGGGGSGGDVATTTDTSTGTTDDTATGSTDDTATGSTSETETNTETETTETTEMDSFSDISDNWAKSYIETLAGLGIVSTTNTNFEPDRVITRAEFLKMTLRAFEQSYSSADAASQNFGDVDMSSWAANVIGKAVSLGVVSSDNANFRPNDAISRVEAMKILLSTAALTDARFNATPDYISSFVDVTEGWQIKYIEHAKSLGIVSGQMNGNSEMIFRPLDSITRAETSKIVVKSIEL